MKYFIMDWIFLQRKFGVKRKMQLPQIVEVKGIRVLTSRQIAEAYGVELKNTSSRILLTTEKGILKGNIM